jgi:hypothetical protein
MELEQLLVTVQGTGPGQTQVRDTLKVLPALRAVALGQEKHHH